jgi:hypothetical protein
MNEASIVYEYVQELLIEPVEPATMGMAVEEKVRGCPCRLRS